MTLRCSLVPKVITLLGILILAGCSRPVNKTQLHFFFRGDLAEIDAVTETVYKFESQHPQVDVIMDVNSNYLPTLMHRLESQQPADVAFVEVRELASLARNKRLLPLDAYVRQDKALTLEDDYPQALEAFKYQGALYALPRDIAPHAYLFYNRDLLEAAGIAVPGNQWTWPGQMQTVLDQVKADIKNRNLTSYVFADDFPCWEALALGSGLSYDELVAPHLLNHDKQEVYKKTLAFFHQLHSRYAQIPPALSKPDVFMEGKLAFFFTGYWYTPYFRINNTFKWDIVLFPAGPAGPRRFPSGSGGYGILHNSAHPDLAWQLVCFLAGKEGQLELAQTGVIQPVDRSLYRAPVLLKPQPPFNREALAFAAGHFSLQPQDPAWNKIRMDIIEPEIIKLRDHPEADPEASFNRLVQITAHQPRH